MDYQTLMNRRGIENEIRQLERDIARKETEANAATSVLSHSPRAPGGGGDKVGRIAAELVYLRGELGKRIAERDEMLQYIGTVENSTIRTALRLYILRGCGWRKIAREMNYSKSGINKKVLSFLKREDKVDT